MRDVEHRKLKCKEDSGMKRIGMLTSGGDCQALNAAMRGVVKCLSCSGFRWLQGPDLRRFPYVDRA